MKSTTSSYGGMAVTVHWVTAILVVVLIGSGFRSGFSADEAAKAAALRVHLPVAIAVLLLTLFRVIWWLRWDRKPEPLDGVPALQEAAAQWTHRFLYLVLFVLLGSGVALSMMSGLPMALFGEAPFPELESFAPRFPHGVAARVLVALVLLHAAAALYHHFGLKDRTLRRMWFGAE